MSVYGLVYLIFNTITKKSYIGITTNGLDARKYQHLLLLRNKKHDNYKLQKTFNKYGENSLKWFILQDYIPIDNLSKTETNWIRKFDSCKNGYNRVEESKFCGVGENHPSSKYSEEIIKSVIFDLINTNLLHIEISQKHNVHRQTIAKIISGISWQYLIDETSRMKLNENQKNTKTRRYKISNEKRVEKYTSNGIHYKCKSITFNGKKYDSIKCASKESIYKYGTLCKYIQKGYTSDEDILDAKKPKNVFFEKHKILVKNGTGGIKTFNNEQQLLKELNIDTNIFYSWLKTGKAQYID